MATDLNESERAQKIRTTRPLVLASSSPRRSEILSSCGFDFDVAPAGIDEESVAGLVPAHLAVELAERKARAVAAVYRDACVIAADTVVELAGRSLSKPESPLAAVAMLRSLRGRSHNVYTGVAICVSGNLVSDVESSEVRIREMTEPEISEYVASGSPMDKAGGYGIQDTDFAPVESFSGSYLNIVGLPIALVAKSLRETSVIDAQAAREIERKDSL